MLARKRLISKAEGIQHGRMLYRIREFDLPSVAAMSIELLRLPQLLRLIRRFDRSAVIAGKAWSRKTSKSEGTLIPGLEVKAFDLNQAAEDKAWLDGLVAALRLPEFNR